MYCVVAGRSTVQVYPCWRMSTMDTGCSNDVDSFFFLIQKFKQKYHTVFCTELVLLNREDGKLYIFYFSGRMLM
jgi:hypothetical protein